MIKISLPVRTVTSLEYDRELAFEIEKSIFADSYNTENVKNGIRRVHVTLPGNSDKRISIRCKHSDKTDSRSVFFVEESNHLSEGVVFHVNIEVDDSIIKETADCVSSFIRKVGEGRIRIGKNTTLGCGKCVCENIQLEAEMQSPAFSILADSLSTDDNSNWIKADIYTSKDYCDRIEADAYTKDGILIRNNHNRLYQNGKEKSGEIELPYIVDEKKRPIIPASTWKGIFRHATSEWVNYKRDDSFVIDKMFGNRNKGIKGCLVFYDSIIQDPVINKLTRVQIDKFSASIMNGTLKESIYVEGSFTIRIECLESIEPYKEYIYLVLRDLHNGRINVGADKGIGRGFVTIRSIRQKISGELEKIY